MEITQLLQDYWWLVVCPYAGVTLLPVWVQVAIGTVSVGTIIWAVRKNKPIEAEAVEDAA